MVGEWKVRDKRAYEIKGYKKRVTADSENMHKTNKSVIFEMPVLSDQKYFF